jgi:hypothetical protein
MIQHLRDIHEISIPGRTVGVHCPYNPKFNYQTNPQLTYDDAQLGCPGCWYHTESFGESKDHIKRENNPIVVKDKPYAYDGSNTQYEKNAVNGIFK